VVAIDLTRTDGVAAVHGVWRYSDARIVPTWFRAAGPEGQPTGEPASTYDMEPKAGGVGFDDSGWEVLEPEALGRRRGAGRISFNWYRFAWTVPERIGEFDTTGSTVVFETSVDDYAEVWVDGELPRLAGQSGGSVVAGWNAGNRLVVGRGVRPGQVIQLAVFGANGPLSNPPTNFIWMREARLEFHFGSSEPLAVEPREVNIDIERLDPRLDTVVSANPKLYKLAEGFQFTEGPVWVGGDLLFSDPNANRIYRYTSAGTLEVLRERSGYQGTDVGRYGQPGSNGLGIDPQGRLTIAEHGNRRITRLEATGELEVLADRYQGRRLNSPNDLVWGPEGALYFTDPPFGLPGFFGDPAKELSFSGVYRWSENRGLELLTDELEGPNGIDLSPDGRFLYVGDWDPQRKIVMRYPLDDSGVGEGVVFLDLTDRPGEDAIDGVEVDEVGNVYVSGPGGLWIVDPDGSPLGLIVAPRHPHNFAWGGGGRTLYLTARDRLYRLPLLPIAGPGAGS
jgi:gluconolactonase